MPKYYAPPQQDDETAQSLNQLLQLAQFAHLSSDSENDAQRLAIEDHRNRVSAAIQLMGLQQQQDISTQTLQQQAKNEDAQRALQKLGIEEVAKSRDSTTKSNVADALITHFSADPSNHKVLASALEQLGYPELAGGFQKSHAAAVQSTAAKMLPAIVAAHQKGGDLYKNVLATAQTDPDVWAALQPHLPKDVTTPEQPSSIGTKLGTAIRTVSPLSQYNLLYKVGQAGFKVGKENKSDFWSALLDKKPQPAP